MLPLATALLALAGVLQDARTRYENHPTGELRAQYEVRVEPDGREVRHGAWTAWYPDGAVESEGRYAEGRRAGAWTFRWPNGKRKEVGEYRDGLRVGTWKAYDERGKRTSQGSYDDGRRSGRWTFWDADGEVDTRRSGRYGWESVPLTRPRSAHGEPGTTGFTLEGETRDGLREGLWLLRRPDGSTAFAGRFTGAGASGPWVFVHPDGTVDPDWMSGRYMLGVRTGPLEGWPEGFEAPRGGEGPDPRRAPPLEVDAAAAAAVEAWIAAEPGAGESAMRPLLDDRQAAFEAAVARLQTLDPASPEGDALGRRLNDGLLRELVGVAYAWRPRTEPDAARANALTALRWRALCELTDPEDPAWQRQLDPGWRWLEPALEWTVLATGPGVAELFRGGLLLGDLRGAHRGDPSDEAVDAAGGRGTQRAVLAALDWLVRTQDAAGCWEPGTVRSVEATGFALQALQAGGDSPVEGTRRESIARGARWLVDQLRADGRIATGVAADLRSHAAALQAVAEAASLSELPALLEATRRGRDYLLAQQLADGSWPRDPGGTEGDTLTTAYAWLALHTVQRTRVRCEAEPRERALAWLDERTGPDGATAPCDEGRVPVTTAWSALCRVLAGRDPAADGLLATQIGWLIAHPSAIVLGDPLLDSEYVCVGAHVLFQVGGKPWETWNSTMKTQLLQVQKREGELAGSWDPADVGPLDRTTVTALRALTFQVYYRYAQLPGRR